MGKFKVGDVVIFLDDTSYPGQVTPGVPKVVQSISPCGTFLRVHRDDTGDIGGYFAKDFAPVQEQDDPLPPVPENVRYNDEYPDHSVYKQTWLDVKQDRNQIYIKTGQYGPATGIGIVLSPDAVLQLAHDLRRLAMKIKREDKY